jgi:hypothetical protein
MNHFLMAFTIVAFCSLAACDKPVPADLPDEPVMVPKPESSIPQPSIRDGRSVDEGIDEKTKSETEKSHDQDIQTKPTTPDGDGSIVIPPPEVDMPPEIVPEKP